MCAPLGPTFWGLSVFPGLSGSLFPLPCWGSSPLFFQISFQFLALPFLLLAPLWFRCGRLKVVPEVPEPLLIFWDSCFFILFWLNVSSFCSKPLTWVPVSFPSLLVPCTFAYISLFIAFTFSSNLGPYWTASVSILISSVLNYASDRLASSSSLSCIFSGALICSFI